MSITDQAFIRAYHENPAHMGRGSIAAVDIGLGSVIPPPHAKFPPVDAPAKETVKSAAANIDAQTHADRAELPSSGAMGSLSAHTAVNKPYLALGKFPKAPLSSFAGLTAAADPTANVQKTALEIDAVRWPETCKMLLAKAADQFDRLAAELRAEAHAGHKITAITGTARGEGRTTLALCLAQRLAAAGTKMALIDADFSSPQIAAKLGIAVDRGWEAALAGEETVYEVMIETIADRFALALLGGGVSADAAASSSAHANTVAINSVATSDVAAVRIVPQTFRVAAVLDELAEQFDLVLVDAGPLTVGSVTSEWLLEPTVGVHNIILAYDVRHGDAHRLANGCLQIAESKQRQLGIAETFV